MAGRLTKTTLLAELRKLLAQPDTRIILKKLAHCGAAEWTPNPARDITIHLDPRRDGRVNLVLHELLHVYFHDVHGIHRILSTALEEAAILAWEYELSRYVQKQPALLETWDRAIQRKIANGGTGAARRT